MLQKLLYRYAVEQGIVKSADGSRGRDEGGQADGPVDLGQYRRSLQNKKGHSEG